MPILSLMYLLAFLDRGVSLALVAHIGCIPYFRTANIGNAKLDGLVTQLDLTGNRYNIALVRNVWSIHRIAILQLGADNVLHSKHLTLAGCRFVLR